MYQNERKDSEVNSKTGSSFNNDKYMIGYLIYADVLWSEYQTGFQMP